MTKIVWFTVESLVPFSVSGGKGRKKRTKYRKKYKRKSRLIEVEV